MWEANRDSPTISGYETMLKSQAQISKENSPQIKIAHNLERKSLIPFAITSTSAKKTGLPELVKTNSHPRKHKK